MSDYTTYTIVIPGNQFGDYLSETMGGATGAGVWRYGKGYYTKWQVKVLTQGTGNLEAKRITKVRVKEISLSDYEIDKRTINRTKEFYDQYHKAKGDYPSWLEDLEAK